MSKGKQMPGVNDTVNSSASTNDFEDNGIKLTPIEGTTSTYEYLYDGNGNMIQDKNKNITVTYNFMNLPTMVNFGGGNKIEWIYSVSGAKLRKTVYTNNSITMVQDYVNGFVYKNSQLDFFGMEEGRVKRLANGSLQYQYTIKDHLGNTRVMFADVDGNGTIDPNTEILQEDHYYAFGLRIEGLSSSNKDNKFTYNGKELEDDHGLNWYHYGARYYDPALGRWHSVDRIDELLSPYLFVKNNPVRMIDPDGNDVIIASSLMQNSTFVKWAENSLAFKQMVALFGKGGPLEKYGVIEFKETSYAGTAGTTSIRYNGATIDATKVSDHFVDKNGHYGAVVTLNPPNTHAELIGYTGWNKGGPRETPEHEMDHVMYSAYTILSNILGASDEVLFNGFKQEEKVGNNGTDFATEYFNKILDLLKININIPKEKLDLNQMIEDKEIYTTDD